MNAGTANEVYSLDFDISRFTTGANAAEAQLNRIAQAAAGLNGPAGAAQAGLQAVAGSAADMAAQLAAASAAGNGAGLSASALAAAAQALARAANGAAGAAGQVTSAWDLMRAAAQSLAGQVSGLAGQLAQIPGAKAVVIAGTITVAAYATGKAMLDAASKVEAYKASLAGSVGGAQAAGEAFDALSKFAAATPFSMDQAVEGFIKLKALGLKPSEEAMTSYGNTASAMGKTLNDMVEAVADAATGEFERLKEFGIKAKQQGDKVQFTFQNVATSVGKDSKSIQDYLIKIGNVNFAGGMDRQAKTVGGAMSALSDQVFLTFAAMGQGKFASAINEIVTLFTAGLQAIGPLMGSIGSVIGSVIGVIGEVLAGVGSIFTAVQSGAPSSLSLLDRLTIAFQLVAEGVEIVGNVIGSVFRGVGAIISSIAGAVSSIWNAATGQMGVDTNKAGTDMGLSIVSFLRTVKYVATAIPELFAAAFSDVSGMIGRLGSVLGRLLTGDVTALGDFGKVIGSGFESSAKKGAEIVAKARATMADTKGAQAWVDKTLGRTSGKKIDDFAGGDSDGTNNSSKKGSDKAAKAEAERQKKIAEYWKTLQDAADTAKLLPLEAERHTKWLELQKIYGDKLSDQDKAALEAAKAKIAIKMAEIEQSKAETALRSKTGDLEKENSLLGKQKLGLTAQQQAVEDAFYTSRLEALRRGVDIDTESYKLAESKLAKELELNATLRDRARLLADAQAIAAKYSPDADRAARTVAIGKERTDFEKAYNDTGEVGKKLRETVTPAIHDAVLAGMDSSLRQIATEWHKEMAGKIIDLGSELGGALGRAISGFGKAMDRLTELKRGNFAAGGIVGQVAGLLGKDSKDNNNAIGTAMQGGIDKMFDSIPAAMSSPLKSMGDSFGSFKTNMGSLFGKGGSFTSTASQLAGQAMAGAQIGGMASSILGLTGLKQSKTGAQLGGAIGSIGGPIGSAIGGAIGGTLGGLLKKTPKASATLGFAADGTLGVSSLTGNNAAAKSASSEAAASVISGLNDIASRLGGELAGAISVSIGQRHGDYRVDTSGSGKTKVKSGAVDFNDDKEGAIKFAISDAIKDGVITGISSFSAKALTGGGDQDTAISYAEKYEAMIKADAARSAPVAAAIKETATQYDQMLTYMQRNAATAAEMAVVEREKAAAMVDLKEELTSKLVDFRKGLDGDGSGLTGITRLTSKLAEFDSFKTDIAGGKTVDQDKFTALGQEVFGLARDVYGTSTSAFQSIRADLISATDGALTNVTAQFNDTTSVAIQQQTDTLAANQVKQIDQAAQNIELQKQILAALAVNGGTFRYINGIAGLAA